MIGQLLTASAQGDHALYARLGAIEAHPVMVRACAQQDHEALIARLVDGDPGHARQTRIVDAANVFSGL